MSEVLTRVANTHPAGTAFSRYLKTLALDGAAAAAYIDRECRSTPQVQLASDWQLKAATGAGTTTDATWAGPLAAAGVLSDVRPLLERGSILESIRSRMSAVPFNMMTVLESTLPSGAWVAQGAVAPVGVVGFAAGPALPLTKAVSIAVITRELVVAGLPTTEAIVRTAVLNGQGRFLDQQLLNPAITATTARPASITNTGVQVTSTGSSAAAISADLGSMVAAITTPASGLIWVMRTTTMSNIAGALGAAAPDLPRTLRGFPVIAHANAPAQITLIDAPEILLADPGTFDVDRSEGATIQMDDNPDNPATASTVPTSFFQSNLIGFRCVRMIHWRAARTGATVWMTVSY